MFPNGSRLIRLTPDHVFKPFDCEDHDLNEFLLQDSKNYLTQLLAVTSVLENDQDTMGFYSLINDKISVQDVGGNAKMDEKIRDEMPDGKRLKSYPAMKIGRLGISRTYKKQGIGTALLDYLKFQFIDNNRTGCRFITVDSYLASVSFYQKNGFEFLVQTEENKETVLMYFDLMKIA